MKENPTKHYASRTGMLIVMIFLMINFIPPLGDFYLKTFYNETASADEIKRHAFVRYENVEKMNHYDDMQMASMISILVAFLTIYWTVVNKQNKSVGVWDDGSPRVKLEPWEKSDKLSDVNDGTGIFEKGAI